MGPSLSLSSTSSVLLLGSGDGWDLGSGDGWDLGSGDGWDSWEHSTPSTSTFNSIFIGLRSSPLTILSTRFFWNILSLKVVNGIITGGGPFVFWINRTARWFTLSRLYLDILFDNWSVSEIILPNNINRILKLLGIVNLFLIALIVSEIVWLLLISNCICWCLNFDSNPVVVSGTPWNFREIL